MIEAFMPGSVTSKTKGPLFIVGCPRSGTTMLVRSLVSNDHIRMIVGESSFLKLVYGNRLFYRSIRSEKTKRNLRKYLNNQKRSKIEWKMLQFNKWIENFRGIGGRSYTDLYFSLMLAFAKSGYYNHSENRNFYVGDKNPSDIDFVALLIDHFPGAKIINIIRDGRATVASMKTPRYGSGLVEAALTWNHYIKVTSRIEKQLSPTNYLRVSYEKIVTNTIDELKTVCNFLRIPFQQKMLTADLNGLSSFVNINDNRIDTKRIDRYKLKLTKEQITLIEYIMEPYLKEYGYLTKDALPQLPRSRARISIVTLKWILRFINVMKKCSVFVGISGVMRVIYGFFRNRFKSDR